jgi:hypothetical protein
MDALNGSPGAPVLAVPATRPGRAGLLGVGDAGNPGRRGHDRGAGAHPEAAHAALYLPVPSRGSARPRWPGGGALERKHGRSPCSARMAWGCGAALPRRGTGGPQPADQLPEARARASCGAAARPPPARHCGWQHRAKRRHALPWAARRRLAGRATATQRRAPGSLKISDRSRSSIAGADVAGSARWRLRRRACSGPAWAGPVASHAHGRSRARDGGQPAACTTGAIMRFRTGATWR